ncbi:MAG: toll/interleukin-1 receptor domain-containing protein, partial [Chthoniobacterales bacterium]
MAHDVFVSHSAKDKAVAAQVVAHLEDAGIRCWVAPRDVVPGADWGESIVDAIESSKVMVLIFSLNANNSSQIKREVERAADKNVYTIPVRIDDIEPTRSLEYFISNSQWMDAFPPPIEPHLDSLARTVKAILARQAGDVAEAEAPREEQPRPTTYSPPPRSRKGLIVAGVVAALLVLAAMLAARYFTAPTSEK